MSASFGGEVRFGAAEALGAVVGAMVGVAVGAGAVVVVGTLTWGAIQSMGCTTATPVLSS